MHRFFVVAPLILASACSTPADEPASEEASSSSIVGGSSTSSHPSVGFLAEPGVKEHHCTGTLIAPNVVLSAAHCWSGPSRLDFGTGTFSAASKRYPAVELAKGTFARMHPSFDGVSHDIAYVVLAEPVRAIAPATLGRHRSSCDFEAVGYGRETAGPNGRADGFLDRRKKAVMCVTGDQSGTTLITATGKDGTTCVGDSGGGLMAADSKGDVIAAVVHGGTSCDIGALTTFQPISTELDFIEEALAAGRAAAANDAGG